MSLPPNAKLRNTLAFKYAVAFLIALTIVNQADARLLHLWSYQEMLQKSDLVAIIEPISSEDTKDVYPGSITGRPLTDFTGHNTTFKVHAVLKGDFPIEQPLVILHFSYSRNNDVIVNGARFASFVAGPLEFKKQVLKDKKEIGNITVFSEDPIWLAFLKKKADGRYEPVTDPYDSVDSFRELHQASFFIPPNER